MQTTEHEAPIPGEVAQRGEVQQSPQNVERGEGVKTAPTTVQPSTNQATQDLNQTQSVAADDNQQDEVVEVVIPNQPSKYTNWKKKPPERSATWLEAFWDRVVKKAKLFGWHVLVKQNK